MDATFHQQLMRQPKMYVPVGTITIFGLSTFTIVGTDFALPPSVTAQTAQCYQRSNAEEADPLKLNIINNIHTCWLDAFGSRRVASPLKMCRVKMSP